MIDSYLVDSITYRKYSSANEFGEVSYVDYTIKAKVDYRTQLVSSPSGEQVISQAIILVKGDDKSSYANLSDVDGNLIQTVDGNYVLVLGDNELLVASHRDHVIFGDIEYQIRGIRRKSDFSLRYVELVVV